MFRLNYLSLKDHPILGSINLSFFPDSIEKQEELYISIIIGQNGTGKSTVLKVISDIFRAFDLYKNDDSKKPKLGYRFRLRYTLDSVVYEIISAALVPVLKRGVASESFYYLKNSPADMEINNGLTQKKLIDEHSIEKSLLDLPTKVLASSLMITDKFNAKSYGIYKYLGVRNENVPSSTGTRTYVRKTVDNIIDGLKLKNFSEELRKLFVFLQLDPYLRLSYVPKYRHVFFNDAISVDKLKAAFIDDWKTYFPKRSAPIWGVGHFDKIKDNTELLERLVEFMQKVYKKVYVDGNKRSLDYEIINDPEIISDYEMIQILRSLDILGFPELAISKHSKTHHFINSSSGETHLISEFIGILSQIYSNSIVLIDEPEISLHPNWQMLYIDQIRRIFHDYPSTHFIIATHSHFLLSDITPKFSNAIALDREDREIRCRQIDYGTYGWSPDDILYNVFKVTSSRNKFIADDLADILDKLSAGEAGKVNKISPDIYPTLVVLRDSLKDNDPLKEVVKSIFKKIQHT